MPKAPSLEINKRNELIYKAQASNKEKNKPKRSAQAQEQRNPHLGPGDQVKIDIRSSECFRR